MIFQCLNFFQNWFLQASTLNCFFLPLLLSVGILCNWTWDKSHYKTSFPLTACNGSCWGTGFLMFLLCLIFPNLRRSQPADIETQHSDIIAGLVNALSCAYTWIIRTLQFFSLDTESKHRRRGGDLKTRGTELGSAVTGSPLTAVLPASIFMLKRWRLSYLLSVNFSSAQIISEVFIDKGLPNTAGCWVPFISLNYKEKQQWATQKFIQC